ncbi:alcohol dehydrogenase catalytic domain-containing protein [Oharaeibacter diazotrophicus]|uniref:2-desacetyl-2-hydroxyethyl bacteriochlorophyllide A dehydrogenase n=1 Tax=Oharaeibacter diazotrophicus TaxID=1920512 RepID=A0A4R6RGV2_9HYPH|nr:alcohol dehydrogenase catalytic domain-containing protein [Oharaeibacter diazotrophicus]TDP85037.1 2-desacetyl-2-hydroxyethyl bacteriochlorophyllide A dehydrogenase [Oharaeibacter diazotrophicus]BBE74007.1 L-threonine 3-dehydrogenase [Pleomorphomonas sp. SM30]GLS76305.1 zinc-binding dehydrogenase [Oharaeibacter diazotrophicus]
MQAIQFPARGVVALADLPMPFAAPGRILVEVRASGICHTDIDVLNGRYGAGAYPLVPGHEFSGTVVALGDGVAGLALGDHVVIDPNLACGTCRACRRGRINLCEKLGAYGVSCDGGFEEYVAVDAARAVPAGDMPFDLSALAEPLGCVLNGVAAADAARAESALVFGAGPIGLLMALALRDAGVAEVAVCERDAGRLAFVESLGLRPVEAEPEVSAANRHRYDLVTDATGVPAVAGRMADYTADGGTVLFFGVCPPDARIAVSPFEVFRRELRLVGSHSLNRNIPEALAVLRREAVTMSRLVSHRLPLAEIAGFMSGGKGAGGTMKVQYFAGA